MARTFDQVYAELGSGYDPSVQLYQQQIDAIPQSTEAAIAQADAKLGQANESILGSARQRGMGFSGIPIAEQAKYAATEYAPAIANVKSSAMNQKTSLLEAVNGLNRDRRTQAQSMYEGDVSRELAQKQFDEQVRQYNESLAYQKSKDAADRSASTSNAAAYLNGAGGQSGSASGGTPSYGRNDVGGYWFKDASGQPIGAYTYAQQAGVDYNDIIRKMAATGDTGADKYLSARNTNVGKYYASNPTMNQNMLSRYNLW